MALRTTITERQRRLGAELRRLREHAGMTVSEAGNAIGMGRVHLTHVECGRTAISVERLRTLCETFGCTSSTYVDGLVEMSESNGRGWWTEYRKRQPQSALDLAELEAGARSIRSQEPLFIPGLLQTDEYMRASFEVVRPERAEKDIEDSTSFRLRRQKVLVGEHAPAVHAVIHEAALHMHIGGPEVMRRQLLHLIELARLPNVAIQVFPYEAGVYAAHSGTFLLITPESEELSTVLLDHAVRLMYMDDQQHITRYNQMFARLTELALPPIEPDAAPESHMGKNSLGLIQHILYTL